MKGVGKCLREYALELLKIPVRDIKVELSTKLYRNDYSVDVKHIPCLRFNRKLMLQHSNDMDYLRGIVSLAVSELEASL